MAKGLRRNSLCFVIFAAALFAAGRASAEIPEPPNLAAISGIAPAELDSRGGQVVTILGSQFRTPVRVAFDFGQAASPVEAFVISVSPTTIVAVSPAVEVGTNGWRAANVIVTTPAGSPSEQRVTLTNAVRFDRGDLTPAIMAVSPTTSSRFGGTRMTIFGGGFLSPVQVFAVHDDGSEREMQVVAVRFEQVTVITPSSERAESVGIRVLNVVSGKSLTFNDAFRYVAPLSILSVTPNTGPYSGGTRVTIEGSGFTDQMAVVVGGIAAQPVETSDHQIIAVTGTLPEPQCSDHTGNVDVMSIDTGSSASGTPFTFTTPRSQIRYMPSQAVAGSLLNVIVKDDADQMRFLLDNAMVDIESRVDNGDGSATYRLRIPAALAFARGGCLPAPQAVTLRMANSGTGCFDTRPLFVIPEQNSGRCRPPRETP